MCNDRGKYFINNVAKKKQKNIHNYIDVDACNVSVKKHKK